MTTTHQYSQAAEEFIEHIRQTSAQAAERLEQLHLMYGARAAYLAGFALTILKERQEEHRWVILDKELENFTFYLEMHTKADAIRLYREAAGYYLQSLDDPDDDTKPQLKR